jgi:hypothetical protein
MKQQVAPIVRLQRPVISADHTGKALDLLD